MTERQALHQYCQQHIQQRLEQIKEEIKIIQQAANEETKSSAGDKYETGRAMAQLEIERLSTQLQETERLAAVIRQISSGASLEQVQSGALVKTDHSIFYIAISLGLVNLGNQNYFVVSPESPIGKLLLNKRMGDSISWNGVKQIIQRLE